MDRCSIKRDMNLKLSNLDQSEGLGASWTAASPGTLFRRDKPQEATFWWPSISGDGILASDWLITLVCVHYLSLFLFTCWPIFNALVTGTGSSRLVLHHQPPAEQTRCCPERGSSQLTPAVKSVYRKFLLGRYKSLLATVDTGLGPSAWFHSWICCLAPLGSLTAAFEASRNYNSPAQSTHLLTSAGLVFIVCLPLSSASWSSTLNPNL